MLGLPDTIKSDLASMKGSEELEAKAWLVLGEKAKKLLACIHTVALKKNIYIVEVGMIMRTCSFAKRL